MYEETKPADVKTRYRAQRLGLFGSRTVLVLQVLKRFPDESLYANPYPYRPTYLAWVDATVEDLTEIDQCPAS